MKTLFSYLPKKLMFVLVTLLAIAGITMGATAAFGPDRPTYTMQNPADHITFNSITDNPAVGGDERAFLTGSAPGEEYKDPISGLQNGDEVILRIYVHNNAAANLDLKATNTKVRVALPSGSKQSQIVTGYISADNATPKEVTDTLDITAQSNGFFELEYIAGSAKLQNNHFTTATPLADSIVTTGALVGYDQINGVVPGCNEFSGWVTLKVKVKMPHYSIEKLARIKGEGSDKWRETVNAKAGDTIEWLINVKNIGTTVLEDIVVLDSVPSNMTVLTGSVKLINSNFPASNPYIYTTDAIQADGKQINVVIGDYNPQSGGLVMFSTKVTDEGKLVCGDNKFTNEAFATPAGYGAVADKAYVVITKDCGQPVYRCDMLKLTTVSDRNIKAEVATTAQNGATLTTISYDFGDGSEKLITDKNSVTYTYAKDGTFTVKAVPSFKIGTQTFTAPSDNCVKQVTFGTPTELPNTGAGSVLGLFAGTSLFSALGYRLWTIRRINR